MGFVRAFQCFSVQQPLEICEELLSFVALQTGIDSTLLQHVSLIEWDNIILYGQYVLDRALARQQPVLMLYFNTNLGATPISGRKIRWSKRVSCEIIAPEE